MFRTIVASGVFVVAMPVYAACEIYCPIAPDEKLAHAEVYVDKIDNDHSIADPTNADLTEIPPPDTPQEPSKFIMRCSFVPATRKWTDRYEFGPIAETRDVPVPPGSKYCYIDHKNDHSIIAGCK